ncbi:uncharacterized protein [Panulirus ornatus]|uniref:uncharacterized protein n=1 Tax=Panulirus ornatus TaxID=150431 RepID=UPI003A8798B7
MGAKQLVVSAVLLAMVLARPGESAPSKHTPSRPASSQHAPVGPAAGARIARTALHQSAPKDPAPVDRAARPAQHQSAMPRSAQHQRAPTNPAPVDRAARTAPKYHAPAREVPTGYDFTYTVQDDQTGATYGHQETRDGYDTRGSYYVPLPDGRLQKVTYYVNGDSGFVAEVTYEGEATYPPYRPAPAYEIRTTVSLGI